MRTFDAIRRRPAWVGVIKIKMVASSKRRVLPSIDGVERRSGADGVRPFAEWSRNHFPPNFDGDCHAGVISQYKHCVTDGTSQFVQEHESHADVDGAALDGIEDQ